MQVFYDNINKFLDSIGRNSHSTKQLYGVGIVHFGRFLDTRPGAVKLNPDTVILALQNQEINVYELLDQFVTYLLAKKLSIGSVNLYVIVIKSYVEYFDIDIVPSKFRRRVKIPKHYREDEFPLDGSDLRNLLIRCHNTRLKVFLLILASSGCRVMEVCTLRWDAFLWS